MGSRRSSVGRATHIVHPGGIASGSLTMMLLVMVAMAAQRAHTFGVLMIWVPLKYSPIPYQWFIELIWIVPLGIPAINFVPDLCLP